MAETTKSTDLTAVQGGKGEKIEARKALPRSVQIMDTAAFATGDLAQNDIKLYNIILPTNAIVKEVEGLTDDLDSNACPAMIVDIGYYAAEKFTSVTSGTATVNAQNAELDVDALVDGDTFGQAATTTWTKLALDTATMGADDVNKPIWEVLGYDADPQASVIVGVKVITAPGTAAAGDMALCVTASIPE